MKKFEREEQIPVTLDLQDERTSAFGRSVVFQRQAYPNMALMTYDNRTGRGSEHLLLTKLVVGIGSDRRILSYEFCDETTTCDNVPGGLESHAVTVEGTRVTTSIYPLLLQEEEGYRGGAMVCIQSEKPGIFLRFGCGNIAFMHHSPNVAMKGAEIDCEEGSAKLEGDLVTILHNDRDFITCAKGNFEFTVCEKAGGGSYVEGFSEGQEAYLMLGFSFDRGDAVALASLDPRAEIQKVKDYYQEKFKNLYIDTPDKVLDEAFTHAYLNLEYSWVAPLGWIESIQHWPTMFHMEQTAAEEWAGNEHRTKQTLLSQLRHMQDNGAVIELHPNHTGRRDWGGENHFFFREVLHYLRYCGNTAEARDFALTCEPYMEKILAQTFGEYDAIGTGVLAWHSQIGNQEDFESTPGRGAATGAEGVKMLSLASDFYRYLGNEEKAQGYAAWSVYAQNQLMKRVWKPDLGRMMWFMDDYGEPRLDTTYHGICYPILYGLVDSFDAQSSIDHLKTRMTGPEGEIYQSNHFGDHRENWVPTWGMQAGSNMQPFATATYACLGQHEEAIRPLDFVATRVCGPYQRGSFPETANETRFGYFSPSAGVYAQEVIESIFGVKRDVIGGITTLSPCMPDSWENAELCLPALKLGYTHKAGKMSLTFTDMGDTSKRLLWRTDLCTDVEVKVNGHSIPHEIKYQCGFCEISAVLGDAQELRVEVSYRRLQIKVHYAPVVACGEALALRVEGGTLLAIEDRCGVFDGSGSVRGDLLDEYDRLGDFGLVNFSRRSFACRVSCEGISVSIPCHITVVPPAYIESVYRPDIRAVEMHVRNHTERTITGDAYLSSGGVQTKAKISCKPRDQAVVVFPFDGTPVPGKNRAYVVLPDLWSGETSFVAPQGETTPTVLTLPDELLIPYADWRPMAYFNHHGCTLLGADHFLKNMPEQVEIGGLTFPLRAGFAPIATRSHRILEIPINQMARKLFVLFSAFGDDHEMCATLFDAEVECVKGDAYLPPLYKYPITLPGEVDYGFGSEVTAGFSTYLTNTPRPSNLPLLGDTDYEDVQPPRYPGRELWCRNHATEVGNTVFNLLEFDLGREQNVSVLRFIARASDAAGGVFSVAYI